MFIAARDLKNIALLYERHVKACPGYKHFAPNGAKTTFASF
jgi:hypothetical protein